MKNTKKSITYQGPKLWNSLPDHLQKLESYHDFKRQINNLFGMKEKGKAKTTSVSKAKAKTKSKSKSKKKKN